MGGFIRLLIRAFFALFFLILLLFGLVKLKNSQEEVNDVKKYNLTSENKDSIKAVNVYLNAHDVKYQYDFKSQENEFKTNLKYYSFFEKVINQNSEHVSESNDATMQEISNASKYYQSLNSKEQDYYNHFLNNYIIQLVGDADEK